MSVPSCQRESKRSIWKVVFVFKIEQLGCTPYLELQGESKRSIVKVVFVSPNWRTCFMCTLYLELQGESKRVSIRSYLYLPIEELVLCVLSIWNCRENRRGVSIRSYLYCPIWKTCLCVYSLFRTAGRIKEYRKGRHCSFYFKKMFVYLDSLLECRLHRGNYHRLNSIRSWTIKV